jgi:inorganic phosphate transporter, PiT family
MAKKTSLDKDLKRIVQLEKATATVGQSNISLGISVLFLVGVLVFAFFQTTGVEGSAVLIVAAIIGGYMALNIGANDVANNVGPAVGSKAITLVGALIIAAVFEAAGAIIAGGDVVTTISKNIIDPNVISDKSIFIWAMMAALLSAALWVNIATYVGAPVSTTHAVVGGVLGAGVAAAGLAAVNWPIMAKIAASWVISPVLGGVIAAAFLGFAKYFILYQEDKITAARRWVPVLVAILASAFSVYLVMKGLKRVWKPDPTMIAVIAITSFAIAYALVRPAIAKAAAKLPNKRKSVSDLFTIPLICAAALLSFAHGANDVANAVGPLAAIASAVTEGTVAAKVTLPIWILIVGAIGISIGLMLYGPKVIEIVGEKITKLNRVRAFCIALSAAITVIIASTLGLPVSSTHIAVGAVFGVGFLREFLVNRKTALAAAITYSEKSGGPVNWQPDNTEEITPLSVRKSQKKEAKAQKRMLVRRSHLMTIIAAWVITVPAAALLSGLIFLALRQLF